MRPTIRSAPRRRLQLRLHCPSQTKKKKKKLKHLVTRSAHHEVLLSRLMRPIELIVPAFAGVLCDGPDDQRQRAGAEKNLAARWRE